MSTRGSFASARSRTGWPSTTMRSCGRTRCPSAARAPVTGTRPAAMAASMARREPAPERARTLCSFSAGPELDGARLDGLCGGLCGLFRRRLGERGDLREIKRLDDVFQGRQLLQGAQPQVIEENLGGAVKGRPSRNVLVAEHLDPAALLQAPDPLGRDRDTAHVLDITARHGLPVGDDRERFQDSARVARRPLRMDALEELLERGLGLEAPAARRDDQLDPAVDPGLAQLLEQLAQGLGVDLVLEHLPELRDRQGLLRGEQRRLEDDLYLIRTEHWRISRRSARTARTGSLRAGLPLSAPAPPES